MNLFKGAAVTFGGNIITGVISLLLSIYLSRTLGPAEKGVFTFFIVVPSLIAMVADLGISMSNVYFLRARKIERTILFTNSFIWSLLFGGVSGFLGYLVLINLHGELGSVFLACALACVPLYLFINLESNLLLAYGKVLAYTLSNVLQLLLALIYTLITFFLAAKTSYYGILAQFLALLTASFYISKQLDINLLKYDIKVLKKSIMFGLVGHIGTVAQSCNYRLDVLILGILSDNKSVGIYSVSYTMAEILWRFPRAIGIILFPKVTGISPEEANDITLKIFKLSNVILFVGTCFFAILGVFIIPFLFGNQFSTAVVPFLALLPGVFLFSWSSILVEDLKGRGHSHVKAWTAGAGLIVTVILDFILIPEYQETGAAIASSVAYAISGIVSLVIFSRITGNSVSRILLITRGDINFFTECVISKHRQYRKYESSDI